MNPMRSIYMCIGISLFTFICLVVQNAFYHMTCRIITIAYTAAVIGGATCLPVTTNSLSVLHNIHVYNVYRLNVA